MARYVALLRAISNVPMRPFRQAMEDLGFANVESVGMSGNLLFDAGRSPPASLERRIAARLGTAALVRTRAELAKAVADDPNADRGGAILFLSRAPTPSRKRAFLALDFEAPRPLLRGRTLYFVYPARLRGRRAPHDLEVALGVAGTARSARVVRQLLSRMED